MTTQLKMSNGRPLDCPQIYKPKPGGGWEADFSGLRSLRVTAFDAAPDHEDDDRALLDLLRRARTRKLRARAADAANAEHARNAAYDDLYARFHGRAAPDLPRPDPANEAEQTRAFDDAGLDDLTRMELAAAETCGDWCGTVQMGGR